MCIMYKCVFYDYEYTILKDLKTVEIIMLQKYSRNKNETSLLFRELLM